jgi:RsiW-degrading membrane proteinase PrsW (M82 family)
MILFGIPLKTLLFAVIGGILPTFIWLRFWLREDDENPEPPGLLILTFIAGMLSIFIVLPIENFVNNTFFSTEVIISINAFVEEVAKFGIVALIAFGSRFIDEPDDYAIYLITGGLGFSALENTLFLLEPITHQNIPLSFFTGNLRFLGATVLHVVTSALIGVSLGLAFYKSQESKRIHFIVGLILATTLHGLFNFFIMRATTQNIITILGVVWVAAIIIMLLFEKLKYMKRHNNTFPQRNFYKK